MQKYEFYTFQSIKIENSLLSKAENMYKIMLSKAENRQNHFMRFDVLTFFENLPIKKRPLMIQETLAVLIHQPKHPQRNSILMPHFNIINGEITVGDVGNLAEILTVATNLEEIAVV